MRDSGTGGENIEEIQLKRSGVGKLERISPDITEHEKIKKGVKQTRDDYLTIINLTGDIIVKVDKRADGHF